MCVCVFVALSGPKVGNICVAFAVSFCLAAGGGSATWQAAQSALTLSASLLLSFLFYVPLLLTPFFSLYPCYNISLSLSLSLHTACCLPCPAISLLSFYSLICPFHLPPPLCHLLCLSTAVFAARQNFAFPPRPTPCPARPPI